MRTRSQVPTYCTPTICPNSLWSVETHLFTQIKQKEKKKNLEIKHNLGGNYILKHLWQNKLVLYIQNFWKTGFQKDKMSNCCLLLRHGLLAPNMAEKRHNKHLSTKHLATQILKTQQQNKRVTGSDPFLEWDWLVTYHIKKTHLSFFIYLYYLWPLSFLLSTYVQHSSTRLFFYSQPVYQAHISNTVRVECSLPLSVR